MRIGHRSWRSLATIPVLLLALGLSACNVNLSAGNPTSSDRAPTTSAGTASAGGRGACEPQTKLDNGSDDGTMEVVQRHAAVVEGVP